jgi:hypothetical protein
MPVLACLVGMMMNIQLMLMIQFCGLIFDCSPFVADFLLSRDHHHERYSTYSVVLDQAKQLLDEGRWF